MTTAIVWFRRDLRLADNPALDAAVAAAERVFAVYVHAPDEEGAWTPGAASDWWLHHALTTLDASLRARGGGLLVLRSASLDGLRSLIAATGASSVFWNRRYEPAVIARDKALKQALREDGVHVASFNSLLMVEPWQASTLQGTPYRVFTPYWRSISPRVLDHWPLSIPAALDQVLAEPITLATTCGIDDLKLLPNIPWDAGFAAHWQPGEAGARAQLVEFLDDAVVDYKADRNRPDHAGTSRLSPYLAWGNISPRQIVAEIHQRDAESPGFSAKAEPYVRELGWREFSYHLLFHFPETPQRNLNARFDEFPWAAVDEHLLAAWQRGNTGIPIVDAGMRELWQTGWMHNRVRMVVASLLTKNLRYHWSHGARWFWDTLVDADLANNTQGWQWTAGTGADAAPYFRVFNPVLQGERFDPDGDYVRRYVPELARVPRKFIHQPWLLKPSEQAVCGIVGTPYARPLIDLAETRDAALQAFQAIKRDAVI